MRALRSILDALLIALALGLAIHGVAHGATWTRDDAGIPAPPAVYQSATGVQTVVTPSAPLPVVTSGGASTSSIAQSPVQGATLLNSSTTGAANTAVATTLTGAAATRVHLYAIGAYCSAGSASLTVADGGTTIWNTPAGAVGTSVYGVAWPVGLTAATANSLVVTLGACGAGNTGTLAVQGDRF